MAEMQGTTKLLSTAAVREFLITKHCGVLHLEKKKLFAFSKTKWDLKYFMISKGSKVKCKWNLFCFADQFANKQEWSIDMSEMESVRDYDIEEDKDFVGMRVIFIAAKKSELILRCDTVENRASWMMNIREAIQEAQSDSTDSGFESGGSISKRSSTDPLTSKRQSDHYNRIDDIETGDGNEAGLERTDTINRNSSPSNDFIQSGIKHKVSAKQNEELVEMRPGTKASKPCENESQAFDEKNFSQHADTIDENSNSSSELTQPRIKISFPCEQSEEFGTRHGKTKSSPYENVEYFDDGCGKKCQEMALSVEETFAKEIDKIHVQDPKGALGTENIPSSIQSFVSVRGDHEVTLEESMTKVSLRSRCSKSQIRDVDDKEPSLKNGQCRDSCSSSGSSDSDSTPIEKPSPLIENFDPRYYLCEEKDFQNAIMHGMPHGTFLIQKKRTKMRLHVMTAHGVKCFKIFEKDGQVSLYKDFTLCPDYVFTSLEVFLKHYSIHNIPKEGLMVKLERGYKTCLVADT